MSNGNASQNNTEVIEVIPDQAQNPRWNPAVGNETIELLRTTELPTENADAVRQEAISILSRCVPPSVSTGQETGLVVGYIQSGKTLSFTTVAALACDNHFPIVIVIAGTSIHLTDQSMRRLRNDLRIDNRLDRKWKHIHNPDMRNNDQVRIADLLAEWHDDRVPLAERRTILITVMKHHGRLLNLINVLSNVNLGDVPVLIVDDEADQAGLNNLIRQGEESTTYQRLRLLKNIIPHHVFLQYTATPQGPLLINLIDVLSPGFAIMLTPGDDYVGGRDFFLEEIQLIREIPTLEITTRNNPLREPPDSLLQALRLFFLGVAVGWVRDNGHGNRSMMIHPSHRTISHTQYHNWVTTIRQAWIRILEGSGSSDCAELLDDFREAYEDLGATINDLEPFEILAQRLLSAIRRTELHLVNARRGRTPQIDWSGSYSHILVGGQALDRGFTVEGLTITYMPRGVGARRADTIEQRARFFGYKRPYLGFCRVFLEQDVANAFHRYIEHEEYIRRMLAKHSQTGRPLSELRRTFLLTRSLMPTRDNIIDIDYVRANFNEGWFYPRAPQESAEYVANNLIVLNNLVTSLSFTPDTGHRDRTEMQRHNVASNVSVNEVYDNFLTNLQFSRLNDAQNFLGVLVIIGCYIEEHPNEQCTIYQMSGGLARERNLNQNSEIPNLFQGAHPVNPPEKRGTIYPGDRAIHSETGVTIQLHYLNIPEFSEQNHDHPIVPNIAIWIPREITGDVIIQDQGNLTDFNEE